jgi:hypothetical protein
MAENLFSEGEDQLTAAPEDVAAGMSCPKKILLVFGLLLLSAVLFIPYDVKNISYETNPQTGLIMRRVFYDRGYIFLPGYLTAKGREPEKKDARGNYYALDQKVLAAEISLIIFLGVADYLLFCVFLKKRAARPPETG